MRVTVLTVIDLAVSAGLDQPVCICGDRPCPFALTPPRNDSVPSQGPKKGLDDKWKYVIGASLGIPSIIISSIIIFCYLKRQLVPAILSADDARYLQCGRQFQCGGMKNISYPFWGDPQPYYCGLPEFKLGCQGQFPTLKILSQTFRVLIIDHDNQVLRLTRLDVYNNTCPSAFMNTTISYLFSYTPNFGNLTMFFGCSSISTALASNKFLCYENGTLVENGYFTIGSIPTDRELGNCTTCITVPVLQTAVNALRNNLTSIDRVLNDGFEVHWITDDAACTECAGSGGRCGYNSSYFKPICFCPDKAYLMRCQLPPGNHVEPRIRIIAASTFGACIILGSHEVLQIPPKPFPSSPNRKLDSAPTPSMLESSTD
ncbi:unnamed protein product [Fraxinus pennsylvanica]|uniref:non-specific serine/threonine protein kinase n=1 Tax=Fraxinus pennsylvanica TaxID=56036 RepID=A0AAD1YWV9_9LAMI|nr:unnamed protein product [Fraxinus pennsylvanica]